MYLNLTYSIIQPGGSLKVTGGIPDAADTPGLLSVREHTDEPLAAEEYNSQTIFR